MLNGPALWDKILGELPKGCVIAGGAIRDYLLKIPASDIDVFCGADVPDPDLSNFHTLQPSPEKVAMYESLGKGNEVLVVYRGTIAGWQVDFVKLMKEKVTWRQVLERFDTSITCGAYNGTLHVTREMLYDLANQTVTQRRDFGTERTIERFEKFNARVAGNFVLKKYQKPIALPPIPRGVLVKPEPEEIGIPSVKWMLDSGRTVPKHLSSFGVKGLLISRDDVRWTDFEDKEYIVPIKDWEQWEQMVKERYDAAPYTL